jgi:hypothetical protein
MRLRVFNCEAVLVVLLCSSLGIMVRPARAQGQPPAPTASAAQAPAPLSEEARRAFIQRVAQALDRTRHMKVVYQDVLGDGQGAWDPDPRYPADTVNCLAWLQLLLAEVYGNTPEEKLQVLDRIRYFDGHVGFGLRKHFIDQWTEIDPLPLRRIPYEECSSSGVVRHHVDLTPAHFQKSIGYGCPLYHADRTAVDLTVIPGPGIVQCARPWPAGYYVMFPVAADRYLEKYGGFSGPMGQVHAVLLEIPDLPIKSRDTVDYKVYHASITSGEVTETTLGSYVLHMWNLYRGYVLYELVPDWDWKHQPALDAEAKAILACESKLQGKVGKLFEHEVASPAATQPRSGGSSPP